LNEGGLESTDQGYVLTAETVVNNVLGTLWALTAKDTLVVTIRSNSKNINCETRSQHPSKM